MTVTVRPDGSIDWGDEPTIGSGLAGGINGPATASAGAGSSAAGAPATATGAISGPATADQPAVRLNTPTASVYPYQPGTDPTYDAWLAQYMNSKNTAGEDAEQRRRDAQHQYDDQVAAIGQQAGTDRQTLQANMLQRGVFNSGETGVRQAQLEAGVLQQNTAAQTGFTTTGDGITSDLQKAIADLDRQNLDQVDSAITRQTARQAALAAANAPAATVAPATVRVIQAPGQAPAPVAAVAPVATGSIAPGVSIAPKKVAPALSVVGSGLGNIANGSQRNGRRTY